MEKILSFTVRGQEIFPNFNFNDIHLVEGSIGYLKANFEFNEDWRYEKKPLTIKILYSGRGKTISTDFEKYNNNTAEVPAEIIKSPGFSITCFGEYLLDEGETKKVVKRLATESIQIPLKISGPTVGETPSEIQAEADAYALAKECLQELKELKAQLGID